MKIMLAGDVMLGRGIDQVLPHPGSAALAESYVRSALTYVGLAEARNGPVARPVSFNYLWGDALASLAAAAPALRIVNLETAVTRRGIPEPKGINYRMAPENVPTLTAAGVDCCVLANNHVLDWGSEGLDDTLEALDAAGLAHAGAGRDAAEAAAPAVLPLEGGGRLLVYAVAHPSSGVPPHWAAGEGRPGVDFLPDFSDGSVRRIADRVAHDRRSGDLVLLSIHWGSNWGYRLDGQRRFAHRLVDVAGIDVIHGHSSHHPKGIERHSGKLVLYGCGDLLNDYEGIRGHEEFRPELSLIYLPELDSGGRCAGVELLPFRIAHFRLNAASEAEAQWLASAIEKCSPPAVEGARIRLVDSIYGLRGVTGLSARFLTAMESASHAR
jgi:poly-gamma-glutamate capsule biosynthesis protein CapA/YwtB (metallophosphatase superfamily)